MDLPNPGWWGSTSSEKIQRYFSEGQGLIDNNQAKNFLASTLTFTFEGQPPPSSSASSSRSSNEQLPIPKLEVSPISCITVCGDSNSVTTRCLRPITRQTSRGTRRISTSGSGKLSPQPTTRPARSPMSRASACSSPSTERPT